MGYLLVGAILLAVLYGAGRRPLIGRFAQWRAPGALLALGLWIAAGVVGLRGAWEVSLVLAAIAAGLTAAARWPRRGASAADSSGMSRQQARDMLGVGPDASAEEIRAAYARLIQRVHPDKGGAPGLAAQLNLARDVLLKR